MEHRFTRDDNLYEDFTVGETIVHPRGRTVSDEIREEQHDGRLGDLRRLDIQHPA